MIEIFTNHIEAILSFLGGCIAGGISVHFFDKKNCNNSHITQKNINAGGDVAGRDINK